MKKLAILSPLVILMASTSLAQDSCIVRPSCADMGYTKTIDDCTGKTTLKCPFDLTKVSCEEESFSPFMDWKYIIDCEDLPSTRTGNLYYYTAPFDGCVSINKKNEDMDTIVIKKTDNTELINPYTLSCLKQGYKFGVKNEGGCIFFANRDIYKPKEECEVGDNYYSDDTCSELTSTTKTKLGVVIDKENKLVTDLAWNYGYWRGFGKDISSITNYTSNPEDDLNGLQNTANGFAALGDYAFKYCYETKTTGGKQWYLPAAGELYKLASNESLNAMLISGINVIVYNSNHEEIPVIFQTSTEYNSTDTWAYDPHNKKLVKVAKWNNEDSSKTVYVTNVCMFSYKD